jgi:hypothetical protein
MPSSIKPSHLLAATALCCLFFAAPALAVKGLNPDGSLDKPTISKAYFEGEFWTVINALEAFRKSSPKISREDSVYAFKYLSVVYAAEPTTRVKAESYMYQLIRMMPTIDLLDLYISDNIQSIFVKVKSDYEKIESHKAPETAAAPASAKPAAPAAQQAAAAPATQAYPAAPAQPAKQEEPGKKSNLKVWAPLALGGIGVATATYFLVTLDSESGSGAKTPRPVDVTMDWPKEGSR